MSRRRRARNSEARNGRRRRVRARRGALWLWVLLATVAAACAARCASRSRPPAGSTPGAPSSAEPSWTGPAPEPPHSFQAAKRLARELYADHRVSFYCGCAFDGELRVDASTCGYLPRRDAGRGRRIEWEHLVPASAFGKQRACWTEKLCQHDNGKRFKGRACCRRLDAEFARMEADLQNLVPAVGELNADRSDYEFDEIVGEARVYGACDFEVDTASHQVEATRARQGEIARAYLYMHASYGAVAVPLARAELTRFQAWHAAEPPSAWETERNRRIRRIQGAGNPWVERSARGH